MVCGIVAGHHAKQRSGLSVVFASLLYPLVFFPEDGLERSVSIRLRMSAYGRGWGVVGGKEGRGWSRMAIRKDFASCRFSCPFSNSRLNVLS